MIQNLSNNNHKVKNNKTNSNINIDTNIIGNEQKTDIDSLELLFPNLVVSNAIKKVLANPNIPTIFDAACSLENIHRYGTASIVYRHGCNMNDLKCLCNFGLWLMEGDRPGVTKNIPLAIKLFERALMFDENFGVVLFSMGRLYSFGEKNVIEKNKKIAFKYFKKATKDKRLHPKGESPNSQAFFYVGYMLAMGEGKY